MVKYSFKYAAKKNYKYEKMCIEKTKNYAQ